MTNFKFFNGGTNKINWEQTGLLAGAANIQQLWKVLDVTYKYIIDNILANQSSHRDMLLIIMARLFREKNNFYDDYAIRMKIEQILTIMDSASIRNIIYDIQTNAYTSIDAEAELTQIIFERCKWEE